MQTELLERNDERLVLARDKKFLIGVVTIHNTLLGLEAWLISCWTCDFLCVNGQGMVQSASKQGTLTDWRVQMDRINQDREAIRADEGLTDWQADEQVMALTQLTCPTNST